MQTNYVDCYRPEDGIFQSCQIEQSAHPWQGRVEVGAPNDAVDRL